MPRIGDSVHLLFGHVMLGHHMSAQGAHGGERLVAARALRLTTVLLHMVNQAGDMGIRRSTYLAR